MLLFFEEVQTAKEAVEVFAQQFAPMLANIFKLAAKRLRHHDRGGTQHGDQILLFRSKSRLFAEEDLYPINDLFVCRFGTQVFIVKQLTVNRRGRILVGEPEHQHLFQGHFHVGNAVG